MLSSRPWLENLVAETGTEPAPEARGVVQTNDCRRAVRETSLMLNRVWMPMCVVCAVVTAAVLIPQVGSRAETRALTGSENSTSTVFRRGDLPSVDARLHGTLTMRAPAQSSGEPNRPTPLTADPAQLRACLMACKAGPSAIEDFCRGLPDPKMRALCWAVVFAGEAGCAGFCYARFGT